MLLRSQVRLLSVYNRKTGIWNMEYLRSKLCPVVVTYTEAGVPEQKLDALKAPYLKLMNVKKYKTIQATGGMFGRPDMISYEQYNTVDLWWAICMYNNIIDPMSEFYLGRWIKVPDLAEMTPLIQSTKDPLNSTHVILVK